MSPARTGFGGKPAPRAGERRPGGFANRTGFNNNGPKTFEPRGRDAGFGGRDAGFGGGDGAAGNSRERGFGGRGRPTR